MYKRCLTFTVRVELTVESVAATSEQWTTRNKTYIHVRSGCALPCRPPIPFRSPVESGFFFRFRRNPAHSLESLREAWKNVGMIYRVRNQMRLTHTEVELEGADVMVVGFFFEPDATITRPGPGDNSNEYGEDYYDATAADIDPLRFLFNVKANYLSQKLRLRYGGTRAMLGYAVYKYVKKLRKMIRSRTLASFERSPLETRIPVAHKTFVKEMHLHTLALFGFDLSTKPQKEAALAVPEIKAFVDKKAAEKAAAKAAGGALASDESDGASDGGYSDDGPGGLDLGPAEAELYERFTQGVEHSVKWLAESVGSTLSVLVTSTCGSSAELRFEGAGFPLGELVAGNVPGIGSSKSNNSDCGRLANEIIDPENKALWGEPDDWDLPHTYASTYRTHDDDADMPSKTAGGALGDSD